MEMSCHALAGMGKGLNRLGVLQFPEDFAHFLEGSLHPRVTPKARRMKSIYNLGVQSWVSTNPNFHLIPNQTLSKRISLIIGVDNSQFL
jgi:hypothetical protein